VRLIGFNLHAPAAPVALLTPPQLAIHKFKVDRDTGGESGDEGNKRLSMRFPGSRKTDHILMIVTDCRVSGLGDQARNLRFAFRHAGLNAGRRVKYPGFLPEFRCPFFVAIAGFEKRVAAKGRWPDRAAGLSAWAR